MLKLKNILLEQGNVKSFTIQTPAPKQVLDIVRNTKPRGTAFLLKSTDVLGEEPDTETIIELLKLDDRFGQNSVWATEEFVYIFGPDTGKAQRKYKITVMIVPKYYIYDLILGTEQTDETKVAAVDSFLESNISGFIGSSNIYLQEDLDTLSAKIAPMLDKELIKSQKAEIDQLKQALATKSEPAAQTQNVVSTEPTITTPETPAVENKAQALLAKLKDAPIKLNTTSDDVKYIQDLIYRIGMDDTNLGEKNDISSWAAFRDAKSQYGTYGTRTKNFIDVVKKAAGMPTTNSDITTEVLQMFLDAGKPLGITESRKKYYLDKFIYEQFNITADIDKAVMGKTTSASTTKTKNSLKTNIDIKSTPSENEVYAIWSLSDSDPWEYRFASLTNDLGKAVWWTRKKDATKWINLKTSMSAEKYNQIKKKLDTATDEKAMTATYIYSNEKKLSTTTTSSNTITAQDIKDSNEMDKIWNNMLDVFVYNPDKYFKKYYGWVNDDEDGAASWIINAYNEAWGSALTRLAKSKSTYMKQNVKEINNVVSHIANRLIKLGRTGSITPTYYYVNEGDTKWKSQQVKFRWDYM